LRRESGQVRYLCQHQETRFKMAFSDSIAKPGTQAAGSLSSAGAGIGVAQACHSANSIPNRGQAGKRRVDRSVTWSLKSREGRSDRHRLRPVRAGKVVDTGPQRRPELRNGGTVIAARNRVIDSSSIVQHLLHLDLGLDPVIGGINFRRSRFVDRFRSSSAPSNRSFLHWPCSSGTRSERPAVRGVASAAVASHPRGVGFAHFRRAV
jgi:hypothetical protein